MLYPKIDTLFKRDPATFKVLPGDFTEEKYSLISEWEWTEKIDGTNIRVMYNVTGGIPYEAEAHINGAMLCSPFKRTMQIGGRTEDAQLPVGVIDYINSVLGIEKLYEVFGNKNVVIFGEGYGDKINDGSARSGYLLPDDPIRQKFIVFDICVGGKFWLKKDAVREICGRLGLDVVPIVELPFYDPFIEDTYLNRAIGFVERGFKSKLGDGTKDAEGLIGRTCIPLFDALGRRLIVKLKTSDFVKGKVKKGKKND